MTCSSQNLIYLQTCKKCGIQYVGETSVQLNKRMTNHCTNVNNSLKGTCHEMHFSNNGHSGCSVHDITVLPIEKIHDFPEISNLMLGI